MAMSQLEALTSAIGDELTLLAGLRSTRLTSQFLPEQRVASGVNSASSVDAGVTITLGSGTFGAAAIGQRFRVLSGPLVERSAIISNVVGPTEITLTAPGIEFDLSNVSWEIVIDAATTMNVEVTLDWSTSGEVFVDGVRYSYAGKTNTTLTGITRSSRKRARGRISCIAGNLINDGETIIIPDGYGNEYTLEFDKDSQTRAGNVAVPITNAYTATQVRDALLFVLSSLDPFRIASFAIDATDIDLVHHEEGTRGNVAISDSVSAATMIIVGMSGGTFIENGAKQLHDTFAEVIDYTRKYSSLDIYRRSFLVNYAVGEELNVIARNLGVERPPALSDDDVFRRLIEVIAYGYRGTTYLIEQILDIALGEGNWELFEDMTSEFAANVISGQTDFPTSESQHHNKVFLRRPDNETTFNGKTFLDGGERRPMTSTTQLALGQTPLRLASLRLARDVLPLRLIMEGSGAVGTASGATVTAPINSFPSPRVQVGDIFEIVGGPHAGKRGTIASVTPTTQITIGAVEGSPLYTIGVNFPSCRWRIYRETSSFRRNRPSDETYIEYTGDPGTSIWAAVVASGATEGANTSVENLSVADGGRFTRLNTINAGETIYYRHQFRVAREARASFEIVARATGTPSQTATEGMQWFFQLCDGTRALTVGLIATTTPGEYNIGFVNPTTGEFIGTPQILTTDGTTFQRLRIEKTGGRYDTQQRVRLYHGGLLREELAYTDAGFVATTDTELRFGILSTTIQTVDFDIKSADWSSDCELDLHNTRVPNGELTGGGSRNIIDGDAGNPFIADDVGRTVRIFDFTGLNAARGNPLGEWEITAFVNANEVTLDGALQFRGKTIGSALPRLFVAEGDPRAFRWPHHLGHQIVILTGPNAGTYTISKMIDPSTLADIAAAHPLQGSSTALATISDAPTIPFTFETNMVELTTDLPSPADDTEVQWRLRPVFATDGGPVPFEIVGTSTLVGANVTMRQAVPFAGGFFPLLETEYTTVLSAQVQDPDDANSQVAPPSTYRFYPFYLFDNWGWIRDIVDVITVGGVMPDFDSMTRDAAGIHIL